MINYMSCDHNFIHYKKNSNKISIDIIIKSILIIIDL